MRKISRAILRKFLCLIGFHDTIPHDKDPYEHCRYCQHNNIPPSILKEDGLMATEVTAYPDPGSIYLFPREAVGNLVSKDWWGPVYFKVEEVVEYKLSALPPIIKGHVAKTLEDFGHPWIGLNARGYRLDWWKQDAALAKEIKWSIYKVNVNT